MTKSLSALTRRLAAYVFSVHRKVVVAECELADAKAEDASADIERQKEVLAYENRRLIQLRAALNLAEDEAEAKWEALTLEFGPTVEAVAKAKTMLKSTVQESTF